MRVNIGVWTIDSPVSEGPYKWWNHERDQWTTPHADRVIKRLKDNCFRDLGKLPANQITPLQVIAVIKKIEARERVQG